MNLSKLKVGVFFLVLALMGWLLYPRELFLGYIYEGQAELDKSEQYYRTYLSKKPHSKFATFRLADLYERMGSPQKALPYLEALYNHRPTDWSVAKSYLDFVKNLHDEEMLHRLRLTVAGNFIAENKSHRVRVHELLHSSYMYARWKQRPDEAYNILLDLVKVANDPDVYRDELRSLDRGLKNTERVLAGLQEDLVRNPNDEKTRQELFSVYLVLDKYQDAKALVEEGLRRNPESIPLMKLNIFVDERIGKDKESIKNVERLLAIKTLDPKERIRFRQQLAYLYSRVGRKDEALTIFQELRASQPEDQQKWLDVFYTLLDMKRKTDLIPILEDYLKKFPDDQDRRKLLVDTYLYDQKDLTRLPLYLEYVKATRESRYALDVGYLLIERNQFQGALDWLKEVYPMFSSNGRMQDLMVETRIQLKQYDEALKIVDQQLDRKPNDPDLLIKAAYLYGVLGHRDKAIRLYDRLVAAEKNDPETLKIAGREILFLGRVENGLTYLQKASELKPRDAETWFWISEGEEYLGRTAKAKDAARKVVDLSAGKENVTPEWTRMRLKVEGRLQWDDTLARKYEQAIGKNPRHLELRADYIDLLLKNKKYAEAARQIEEAKQSQPGQERWARPMEVRLAMARKEWGRAITMLRGLVAENPNLWSYRRDLAEAYLKSGEWQKSMQELESIQKATGDEYKVAGLLEDLHEKYDKRVTGHFQFQDLSGERAYAWGGGYKQFVGKNWALKSDVTASHHNSPSRAFEGKAVKGVVTVAAHHLSHWVFEIGAGGGHSARRNSPTALAEVTYQPLDNLTLNGGFQYRELRTDVPQAVAAGNLRDLADLNWQYQVKRFIVGGQYRFERNYLPGGAESTGHAIEPSLAYIVFRRPQVTVGYHYTFLDVNGDAAYFAAVPLIREMSAHYITGNVAHRILPRLTVEAGGFIGEDTARNLHLAQADLWGVRAGVKWGLLPWLDLSSSYDFGRETLSDVGGESHFVNVGISGHWQ